MQGFFDPSVQFGLQFEEVGDEEAQRAAPANAQDRPPDNVPEMPVEAKKRLPASPTAAQPEEAPEPEEEPPHTGGGAEVVRLDRFRKK